MQIIDRTNTTWGIQADKLNANFSEITGNTSGCIYIEGASFVDSNTAHFGGIAGNTWFETACSKLNVTGINRAVSGTSILDMANKMYAGTEWTESEFEQFDVLVIMHVLDYDPSNNSALQTSYLDYSLPFDTVNKTPVNFAQAYDYVLKKYAAECYSRKDVVDSRWYGTKEGKPVKVAVTTHWHDARVTFNTGLRTLRDKWGFKIIEFDKNVGFSKNQVHSVTGAQVSILYCNNGIADTEDISGVTYGWHLTRGNSEIQKMLASIFATEIKTIM